MEFTNNKGVGVFDCVSGLMPEDELEEVRSALMAGDSTDSIKRKIERDWHCIAKSDERTEKDLTPILHSIHHQINLDRLKKEKSLLTKISGFYLKAAAVLMIPLIIGGILLLKDRHIGLDSQPATASIYAPAGSRVAFSLPDGTEGMLNSSSSLTYSMPFYNERNVTLSGEAWFEVKHDEKHPFNVAAGSVDLTVLGTSFNVSAYPEDNYTEVVLESGQVMLKSPVFEGNMIMRPSECFVLENGKMRRSMTDPAKYMAWTEGKLVFRSDPMSEVAKRIERWYNVRVKLMDDELERYAFRATFEDDPLEEVLRFLSMTSPIRYEITPGTLGTDSTYIKSEVKIYLK